MAYKTTACLGKLTCTDYVEFGKCQDRFGRIFWSKIDSNYLDVKLKVFKRDGNIDFRLVQILTIWEAAFNRFKRSKKELFIAPENFGR